MKVEILSKKAMRARVAKGLPPNAAVISFYTPHNQKRDEVDKIDFEKTCQRVFYVGIPDIDIEVLPDYGYTYETYLTQADELAQFIYQAKEDDCDILCQCDYGQSRSAACAAAILQHFEQRGIDIFADYRYYCNQVVYHKVLDALTDLKKEKDLP